MAGSASFVRTTEETPPQVVIVNAAHAERSQLAGNLRSGCRMAIKHILVPVDFSAPSLRALDYAIDFARPLGAELIVVFVVEPIYSITPGDLYAPSSELTYLMQEQRQQGKEQLAQLEARLQKRYKKLRTVLGDGLAYQAIVDAAKKLKVDLIVMATHGRTGLSHLFMGSVAEKVVRTALCPVLTIRVPEAPKQRRSKRARS